MTKPTCRALVLTGLLVVAPAVTRADAPLPRSAAVELDPADDDPAINALAAGSALELAAALGGSLLGFEAAGQLRYDLGDVAVGVDLGVARGRWYPRGLPTDEVNTTDVRAAARWTLLGDGAAGLELAGNLGVRRYSGFDDPVLAVGGELDATAVVTLRDGVRARIGLAVPVTVASGELDQLDQRLHVGADLEVSRDVWVTADVHGGGAYGYDGDGAKFDSGVMVGVRFARLADAPTRARRAGVGAFVSTEWRALMIGDHASHGPGYAVGATLLGGHLKIGIAGFNRPGPINPTRFEIQPVDGQTWNGKSTVALRSDGNFVGLHVAPVINLGRLRVEVPITFGQAAFGFYLHGADREAVTGERVSAVENRLFAGRDSSFALGLEGGLTAAYRLSDVVAPFASFHYLATFGYDAIGRDDYGGASLAVGVALTP